MKTKSSYAMQNLKVKVYGIFKVTKKQFLIIEMFFMTVFIALTVITYFAYDKPWHEYESALDQWSARYSIYIWIACIALAIMESQFYLHRFTKAQLKIIEEQKKEIENHKSEIEAQRDEIHMQNEEITSQRDLLVVQKEKIETILSDQTASIEYAERIQKAILPNINSYKVIEERSLVILRPRDIVSGDFYWYSKIESNIIVVAADCTGHGVPGAFMSMLGISLLNEIVNGNKSTKPSEILNKLRNEIVVSLHQQGENQSFDNNVKDGMDMAVFNYNSETGKLEFAGANNPLYIVSECNELDCYIENTVEKLLPRSEYEKLKAFEVKADKMPVAIYEKMDKFQNKEVAVNKGDRLYVFSDGLPDQFGGPKGKKLKYKAFRQLLLESAVCPISQQKIEIENFIDEWISDKSGDYEQLDDICILGFEV
ncbi:MAG: hypothetical protein C0594_01015 [Marinilabiliales bacterium]|nr:MAG: hypothetical protein C0594_01015 [Marinilabiliales bacterium]